MEVKVVNGDCLDVLKTLHKNSIDLCVTSPPYDNLRTYEGLSFEKFKDIAQELYRAIKWGGVIIWVVGDAVIKGSETGTSFRQALYFMECGFNLHDTMIYEKNSSTFPARPTASRYSQIFEYMFVFSKGTPKTSKLICDKRNKWAGHKDFSGKLKHPVPEFSPRTNIWKYTTSFNDKTGHPAVFPEALAQDHILTWSNKGDIILDPFMGSGTTGKMAILNDRDFIGIELDEEYFRIAEERLHKAQKQKETTLF